MNIGEEQKRITIIPATEPQRIEQPRPARKTIPRKEPAKAPQRTPVPEKVPAGK